MDYPAAVAVASPVVVGAAVASPVAAVALLAERRPPPLQRRAALTLLRISLRYNVASAPRRRVLIPLCPIDSRLTRSLLRITSLRRCVWQAFRHHPNPSRIQTQISNLVHCRLSHDVWLAFSMVQRFPQFLKPAVRVPV